MKQRILLVIAKIILFEMAVVLYVKKLSPLGWLN